MTAILLYPEWARRCNRSRQRAIKILDAGYVPDAVPVITGPKRETWGVLEGTPWPEPQNRNPRPVPPLGFLHVSDWAKANGRNPRTVAFDCWLGKIPEAINQDHFWFVPETMAWPVPPPGRPLSGRGIHDQAHFPESKKQSSTLDRKPFFLNPTTKE